MAFIFVSIKYNISSISFLLFLILLYSVINAFFLSKMSLSTFPGSPSPGSFPPSYPPKGFNFTVFCCHILYKDINHKIENSKLLFVSQK